MAVLIHFVCAVVAAAELNVMVLLAVTVIVPVEVMLPHPPVSVMVKLEVAAVVGVPLMVTTFAAQVPVKPVGNPENVAFVAPVVA